MAIVFTVGEFAQIAHVSRRLLRYYDEIGLLKPVHSDRLTGYRYYSAAQLPDLNRIIALKDLGLSLEQIQRVMHDKISAEELQGMLLMKKAEIEQQLQAELRRIRRIESRLQFLQNAEANEPPEVVIKQIPAQPVMSARVIVEDFDASLGFYLPRLHRALPGSTAYGPFFAIWHSGGPQESESDLEFGRILKTAQHAPVPLTDDLQLTFRELPAVETMATFVVQGPVEHMHLGYSAIGSWAEINGYRFSGPPREIVLQLPQSAENTYSITEVQFPVEPTRQS